VASKKIPLSVSHPELAKQAYGWDPDLYSAGSSKKQLSWKCNLGHIWEAPIARRAGKQKSGCPYCSNSKVLAGFNDLATTNVELLNEVHGWDPTKVIGGSRRTLEWKCSIGHVWKAPPADRVGRKTGCPICTNKKLLAGFNDLESEFPELAREAYGWDPKKVISRSGSKRNWKCKNGHTWKISPSARIKTDRVAQCPYCTNHFVWIGFNDLMTTDPELAKEAYEIDPRTLIAGSPKVIKWRCSRGHIFKMSIANRSSKKKHGCSVCAGRQVHTGRNDLRTLFPDISKEAFGWDPAEINSGHTKKLTWKCNLGHIYEATPKSRTGKAKTSCPYCSNTKLLKGFNDLLTINPTIASEAFGWDPSQVISGSHSRLSWKCSKGHIWKAQVGMRIGSSTGCPYCANKRVYVGFNDLVTTHPEIAEQSDGWDPKTFVAGSHKKVFWKCELGHRWRASISDRTNASSKCPTCYGSGFDSRLDGWLYLIEQRDLGFLQIGISNFPDKRLEKHQSRDWILLDLRGPMSGELCRELETQILRFLRKHGANMVNKTEFEKFDGYTESWIASSFKVKKLSELIQISRDAK
jgi:uncharacterized Zn-finger protein